jgi:hypothetical protein
MRRLLPIVEGHGESHAVPLIIRRILSAHGIYDVEPLSAQRKGEYPTVVRNFDTLFQAAILVKAPILWVMDFDSKDYNCPVKEAQQLLARAATLRPGWPIKIAFLVKEYETLFLIDEAATRKAFPDIPAKTSFPQEPEKVRGAKEWLSKARPAAGHAYKPMVDQAKITAHLDLDLLRTRSPDFAHLERAVLELAQAKIPA